MVAVVFAVSAVSKTTARHEFAALVERLLSILLPRQASQFAPYVAGGVVAAEFGTAAAAVAFPPLGASAALALLAIFSLVAAFVMSRHIDLTCSCFGNLGTARLGSTTLFRNTVLSAAAVAALLSGTSGLHTSAPAALLGATVASSLVLLELVGPAALLSPSVLLRVAEDHDLPPVGLE